MRSEKAIRARRVLLQFQLEEKEKETKAVVIYVYIYIYIYQANCASDDGKEVSRFENRSRLREKASHRKTMSSRI